MSINVRGLQEGEINPMIDLVVRAYAKKELGADRVVGVIDADLGFKPELNRVIEVDGKLVARLCIHDRMMNFGGDVLRVGAIGGVCVDPEFRRRGFCNLLLADATTFMEKNGFDVSLLFGEPSVYGGSGWQTLVTSCISTNLSVPDMPGITVKAADINADGVMLQSLHQQFNSTLTGPFARSTEYWNRWISMMFRGDDSLRIWIVNGETAPLGYFIDRAGSPGVVNEMAWICRDAGALPGVLSAIARQSGDARLSFPFYLPELRDAILYGSGMLSLEKLRDKEYDLRIRTHYSGLFKLISPKNKPLQDIRDTADLLQLLRHRDYVFWWLDHF